jgi:hypothetical protein
MPNADANDLAFLTLREFFPPFSDYLESRLARHYPRGIKSNEDVRPSDTG